MNEYHSFLDIACILGLELQGSNLALIFEDLSQREKLSEIDPPLER